MKKAKKALLLVLCAALLVGASVAGTLAYMTAKTDTVTNTFTVGNINIKLNETGTTELGAKDETKTQPVTSNTYKLIPGTTYIKDPVITVEAGNEACYLFFKVEEPSEAAKAVISYELNTEGWTPLTGVEGTVYYRTLDATQSTAGAQTFYLLKGDSSKEDYKNGCFSVADTVTAESLSALEDESNLTLSFTAYAIQKEGFDDAALAWTAVQAAYTSTTTGS